MTPTGCMLARRCGKGDLSEFNASMKVWQKVDLSGSECNTVGILLDYF